VVEEEEEETEGLVPLLRYETMKKWMNMKRRWRKKG